LIGRDVTEEYLAIDGLVQASMLVKAEIGHERQEGRASI
jgi:hypothetical protein